jgi:hypothetical protein
MTFFCVALSIYIAFQMELPTIGRQCSLQTCNRLDFLPFKCDSCGLTFCSDHRLPNDHSCAATNAAEKVDQVAANCPLCNAVIVAPAGSNINARVSHHIDGGCQRVPCASATFKCQICPTKELIEIKVSACGGVLNQFKDKWQCELCGGNFCVKHRSPTSHSCARLESDKEIQDGKRVKSHQNAQSQASILERIRTTFSGAPQTDATQRVRLMQMRSKAKGDAKITPSDRVYLECVFPFSAGLPPQVLFFNKNHAIGKVLDLMATHGSIANHNNQSDAPKLHLFEVKTGTALSNSDKLATLVDKGVLRNGDAVLLEYLENVID